MRPSHCPLCAHSSVREVVLVTDRRKGAPGTWSVYSCELCKGGFLWPQPLADELSALYAKYYSEQRVSVPPIRRGESTLRRRSRRLLRAITGDVMATQLIRGVQGDRVLDVGCGPGHHMVELIADGYEVAGVEISQDCVSTAQASGLNVRHSDLSGRLPFNDDSFEYICCLQVLEHLPNPALLLKECARLLTLNGRLFLTIPNFQSYWKDVFQSAWVAGWFAPFHLFHFSRRTIDLLAENCGLRVVRSWSTTPESWFRLNLKAAKSADPGQLISVISVCSIKRLGLGLALRFIEMAIAQRDCLVVELAVRDVHS